MASEFYDEKAAARILSVHPRTVRRMRKKGQVSYFCTPTGRIRYRLEDLLEATRSQHVPSNVRK